jgi:hypothetical protein
MFVIDWVPMNIASPQTRPFQQKDSLPRVKGEI